MASKLEKMQFLAEVLNRCMNKEPQLTPEDLALILSEEIEDMSEFLKVYKKKK